MNDLTRRQALAALGAATCAGPTVASGRRHYALIALVGDELELTHGNPEIGSSLDRNVRKSMPDADAAFDKIALLALQEEVKRNDRNAQVSLLGVPPSRLHREPERLFDGNTIALPGSLVDALTAAQATHVVLLTKRRAPTKIPMVGGPIGYGNLRGLGYYVDNFSKVVVRDTGQAATGLLAVFVYVQLTLADARTGQIVAQRPIESALSQPVALAQSADPWEALAPQQKFEALRALLQTQLRKEMPALLTGS